MRELQGPFDRRRWHVALDDLLRIGERATNLARAFNVLHGFSRKDDVLPRRLFEPLPCGPMEGVAISKPDFERTMGTLYELKGWNPVTAAPTRDRLRGAEATAHAARYRHLPPGRHPSEPAPVNPGPRRPLDGFARWDGW